ncbi:MAG: transketolase C-terminal domain-containing protein [Candidatus Thalassarchaeaceae archaeon]|jgi:transketolase|nr:transketolase [Euryarchaeota archaeon]MDP6871610.1 transketolase C-terminal domain-containing protein [Candidatus Thalassarchaeaceae archaeon]|tara:strand:+ start:4241 stop:5188 length:948 start_codon:yes stop_codon:yes gene_type:complete
MSAPSAGGASRDGYGSALLKLSSDPRVVVLEADLGKSTKSCLFRAEFPERTVSLGIAEQNMMLVAAGMASSGKIPFASTFAIFTERAFEQVRNGIARPGLPVHICGSHGGIHTGTDGSSAQSIEDLAIYRTIPGLTVITPSDDISAEELTIQLLEHGSASYTRTARNKTPRMYDEESVKELKIGKGSVLRDGDDLAIIACGVMVSEAMEAASTLAGSGIDACVIDMHTIKPLDTELLDDIRMKCGGIVTAEDHSVIGGLGSAVAEYMSSVGGFPVQMVGVEDRFGESGSSSDLMESLGLTRDEIVKRARGLVNSR